jgi:hypothetical protein
MNDELLEIENQDNISLDRESINGTILSRRALDKNKFSFLLEKFC